MSGAVKMRHTEITIKQGKTILRFELPTDLGGHVVDLLRGLEANLHEDSGGFVSASEVFPDIKDHGKRIGIIFRGLRLKSGLTQVEVARQLGIDQADVSKIEKGKRSIGKVLAKKIEKEFGIDYRRLL